MLFYFINKKSTVYYYKVDIMINGMKKSILNTLIFCFINFGLFSFAVAQNGKTENFKFRSFGLSMGIYNPELDYWKNDTNSEFRNSDFSQTIFVQGFVEYSLIKNLVGKIGVGVSQSRNIMRLS